MTFRSVFSVLTLLLSGATAFAHDGDHSGMTQTSVQLHHVGPTLLIGMIIVAAIMIVFRKRNSVRDVRNARSGR